MTLAARLDWGDVPTWIGAAATLLAVVSAIWAGRAAWLTLVNQNSQDERREAHGRRRQASRISAWKTVNPRTQHQCILLHNGSEEPVYNVFITLWMDDRTVGDIADLVVPPGDQYRSLTHLNLFIPENIDKDATSALAEPALETVWDDLHVSIRFLDATGLSWSRDTQGRITERFD